MTERPRSTTTRATSLSEGFLPLASRTQCAAPSPKPPSKDSPAPTSRDLLVTGAIATAAGVQVGVPAGATAVVLNVTVVSPTAPGQRVHSWRPVIAHIRGAFLVARAVGELLGDEAVPLVEATGRLVDLERP